ncbi:MAG: thioredoxin family protein [Bacteroidetes bacterium]|nr:thioredoxin family protein [Bacteroidota bacterium]MBS1756353.1 thioredoxin family protein [Bacteroidota bacterium]
MKFYLSLLIPAFLLPTFLKAQTTYTSTVDNQKVVILNGIITKYALENNQAFTWYKANQNGYTPDTAVVNALAGAKDAYRFVIFGGTWCGDTQFILPKFFKLQEMAGFSDSNISFFAVNRAKQTIGNITAAFNITNVPTIIVMKNGLEVGRVVEYGKTGHWDRELIPLLK